MVLSREFDLSGAFEAPLGFRLAGGLVFGLFFAFFIPLIEANSCFQYQENVISGAFDLANSLGDPVGLRELVVDRVPQFLHQVLQWLVHNVLPHIVGCDRIRSRCKFKSQPPYPFRL